MKILKSLIILSAVLVLLALPATALAKGLQDDQIVTGGTFTLESGSTLDGNLIVLGGVAATKEGSTVAQDVVLMGGTLTIDGLVRGNVVGVGGVVSLGDSAVIEGDVTTVAASLNQAPGAQIQGQVVTGFRIPAVFPKGLALPQVLNTRFNFSPIWSALWFLFRTFLWGAVAVLVVILAPYPSDRAARAIASQPLLAGGVGLLTAIAAPLVLLLLAITILLIPISLLAALILVVAWLFGRIAVGMEVGRRIGAAFNKDWPAAVDAGLGTFVLAFIVDGTGSLVPCVGWILPALVGVLGLGGVILTVFGTRDYPPQVFPKGGGPITQAGLQGSTDTALVEREVSPSRNSE